MNRSLLKMQNLRMLFPIRGGLFGSTVGHTHAVDGVDLEIQEGKTLGLVGESGSGKSTLGRINVRLLRQTGGKVFYEELDLDRVRGDEWRKLRPKIQMVFQDTQASLDPRMTVKQTVAEPIRLNRLARGDELFERVAELIRRVGLAVDHLYRYPHELSGGQRQRVVIARALATDPRLIVLDEPTSALDVSVQAQILNLLRELQKERSLTYLFISHDLSVVRFMSDEVAVMYVGRIVEKASSVEIFHNPLHPYTRALFAAVPVPDPAFKGPSIILGGDIPSADHPPSGCRFHPRCPRSEKKCHSESPELLEQGLEHLAACHFADEFKGIPVFEKPSIP
jgi:oligopeptide/dipeptide ABC transporter ATP-binding protein